MSHILGFLASLYLLHLEKKDLTENENITRVKELVINECEKKTN
jgi:hypothetical protein